MSSFQSFVLGGNLAKDPESRAISSGDLVCNFVIPYQYKKDGQTTWFHCSAFGKTAEFVQKFFQKGKPIVVIGQVQSRDWEDKSGNKRTSWEVRVTNVNFAPSEWGNGEPSETDNREQPDKRRTTEPRQADLTEGNGDAGDDVPW